MPQRESEQFPVTQRRRSTLFHESRQGEEELEPKILHSFLKILRFKQDRLILAPPFLPVITLELGPLAATHDEYWTPTRRC